MAHNAGAAPTSKLGAIMLIVLGALVLALSVFADSLGISGGGEGFGWKQLIGAIAGLVVLLIGIMWLARPRLSADDR